MTKWISLNIPVSINPSAQTNRIILHIPSRFRIIIPKIIMMQPRLPIKILSRKPQIIANSFSNNLRLTKRLVSGLPNNIARSIYHPLRRTQMVILVIIHLPAFSLKQRLGHPGAVRRKVIFGDKLALLVILRSQAFIVIQIPGSLTINGFFDALAEGVIGVFANLLAVLFNGN